MGRELQELKDSFDPTKPKKEDDEDKKDSKKQTTKHAGAEKPKQDNIETKSEQKDGEKIFQEPKSVSSDKQTDISSKISPNSKSTDSNKELNESLKSPSTPKLLSPAVQSKPDSSSTPRSETSKTDIGSPTYSPLSKPDSQVQTSPDLSNSFQGSNSWSLGQFKTTPTHRSEASPLNKSESHAMMKPGKSIEQCSPTTSQENKPSPETLSNYKQDSIRTPNSYYGGFSPMTRQENQFSSQRSPYSAQPSPAQPMPSPAQPMPSPYSAQPSPYSTQPSPYSSQPSPYSAQPSPDTSQIGKPELQKSSSAWNTGSYSPMPKHPAPFSPHPSPESSGKGVGAGRTPGGQYHAPFSPHPSPESAGKGSAGRTPGAQYPSPFSPHPSPEASGKGHTPSQQYPGPFSPHPSPEPGTKSAARTPSTQYPGPYSPRTTDKKSPAGQPYSPLMRGDCLPPTATAASDQSRQHYPSASQKQDHLQNMPLPEMPANWGLDRYNRIAGNVDPVSWRSSFQGETRPTEAGASAQPWSHLPPFEPPQEELHDPWALGQFRMEPPHQSNYIEQAISLEQLSAHIAQQPHLQSFIEEHFPETSRVD